MKNDYPYSTVSTVEGEFVSDRSPSSFDQYPGQRRNVLHAPVQSDRIFIKTAGNALQAVPRAQLEQKDLIAVNVPGISKPGDEIFVLAPDGRILRATIPLDACAGQIFFVHAPPMQVAATGIPINPNNASMATNRSGGTQVVSGEDVEKNDLTLAEGGAVPTASSSSGASTTSLVFGQIV